MHAMGWIDLDDQLPMRIPPVCQPLTVRTIPLHGALLGRFRAAGSPCQCKDILVPLVTAADGLMHYRVARIQQHGTLLLLPLPLGYTAVLKLRYSS